jgi:predicted membrane protein
MNFLFGNENYDVLYNADKTLGTLFFFIYLFIVNMILINLFLALIYSSYIQVKYRISKIIEKYSLRRVYLFCCHKKKMQKTKATKQVIEAEYDYDKRKVK